MYQLFNSCFSKNIPRLSVHEHILLFINKNQLIISNENTYTITLIMNECTRYVDEIYHDKSSSFKYYITIQCMQNILEQDILDSNELNKLLKLVKACVFVHFEK